METLVPLEPFSTPRMHVGGGQMNSIRNSMAESTLPSLTGTSQVKPATKVSTRPNLHRDNDGWVGEARFERIDGFM